MGQASTYRLFRCGDVRVIPARRLFDNLLLSTGRTTARHIGAINRSRPFREIQTAISPTKKMVDAAQQSLADVHFGVFFPPYAGKRKGLVKIFRRMNGCSTDVGFPQRGGKSASRGD